MPDEEMEMESGEAAAEGEPKKGGGMKMIIIILVLVLVLFGAGFAGWWFFLSGPDEAADAKDQAAQTEQAKAGEAGEDEAQAKPGTIVELSPFVVNLADPGGKRYLKLTMAVDAGTEPIKAEIEVRMPQIRDAALLLLSSKKYAEIADTAGKNRLKTELLKVINRYLAGVGSVHALYFTEFVIQ